MKAEITLLNGCKCLIVCHTVLEGPVRPKKFLLLGPPKSKTLGHFLQHMQKSKIFGEVFWRNRDLKIFPYKTSRVRNTFITKWSVWRSIWSKKIPLKNVVGHSPFLHQKCPYFLDLIKWFRKKARSSYLLSEMAGSGFFSEPFDQNKKVMAFLMQNRPMANKNF